MVRSARERPGLIRRTGVSSSQLEGVGGRIARDGREMGNFCSVCWWFAGKYLLSWRAEPSIVKRAGNSCSPVRGREVRFAEAILSDGGVFGWRGLIWLLG